MSRHLIYGATSLISINLIKQLSSKDNNNEFYLFCRDKKKLENLLDKNFINKKNILQIFEIDILNIELNLKIITEQIKNIDYVYFLTGVTGDPVLEFSDYKLVEKNFKINLINPITIINHLSFKINNNGGICVITSIAGLRGRKLRLHYCSAKAGLINYLSGLQQHLNEKKISVTNCVAGYMKTSTFNLKASSFLISSPESVASKIIDGTEKKKHIIFTSFYWRIIAIIIIIIPNFIYRRLKF